MKLIKPRAQCSECGASVYENVDPSGELACGSCAMRVVDSIINKEEQLHTKFIDTDDYNEKMTLYKTKVGEAEEVNGDVEKIRVKSLGGRLKKIRTKLGLSLVQLAEYFDVQSKSTVYQYEKDVRQIPENIKGWTKTSESIFKHLGREKGGERILNKLRRAKQERKESVTLQKGENPLRGSSQLEGGCVG